MKMNCVGLDLKYWDKVKESILTALKLDGGRLSIEDIKNAVYSGISRRCPCGGLRKVSKHPLIDPQYGLMTITINP